jgi:hypothetical protein
VRREEDGDIVELGVIWGEDCPRSLV